MEDRTTWYCHVLARDVMEHCFGMSNLNKQETQIKGALRLLSVHSLKPSISLFTMGISCDVKDLVP